MGMSGGGGGLGGDFDDGPRIGTHMSEINITPFVDVMLVLLVIFMVTAPLMTQGVDVNLPRVSAANLEQRDEQPIVLTVKADGECSVGDLKFPCSELAAKLPAVYENRSDRSLFIRGDVDARYGLVMQVLAGAREAGVLSTGLVTEPPEPEDDEE
jgi:biopolymer transport protein TolR